MQTILAFGYHDQHSPRHWSVCEAFRKEGAEIIECHTDATGLFGKYRDLARKYRLTIATTEPVLSHSEGVSSLLVTFPGHFLMPLAWWLTRRPRKRLIFDAFISLYDTEVSDRRRFSRWNPWAWILWLTDWLSMHLADEVLIDTETHRRFLIERFGLRPERVRVIYLEARSDLFHPISNKPINQLTPQPFTIFFYGTAIPLQGIPVILDAAKILEEQNAPVHFMMLGTKHLKNMIDERSLHSMEFKPFVNLEELPAFIHGADLCLGIFGTSGKAQRVIPHKVIDAVACGVPVLTADTHAMRERFANHPLVHRVQAGNPQALAEKILQLGKNLR